MKAFFISGCLILLALFSNEIYGQNQLTGIVIDASNDSPIPFANVAFINTHIGTISDENGAFSLEYSHPGRLNISHIGYASAIVDITATTGSQFLEVRLEPTTILMDEIEVVHKSGKTQISRAETPSIIDYLVKDDGIITINYLNSFAFRRLSFLSFVGEEMFFVSLPDDRSINEIYKTCNESIYLLSNTHAYLVEQSDSNFILADKVNLSDFEAFVMPCKGRIDNTLFYLTERNNGLTNILSASNPFSQQQKKLMVIEDKNVVENYLRDFNLLNSDLGSITTNNYTDNQFLRNLQNEAHFYKEVFYKLKYPNFVFIKGRTTYLFDHLNNKILTYRDWALKKETPLDYIENNKWTKRLFKDEQTGNIYGLFKDNGQYQIRIIDPLNGKSYFDRFVDCQVGQIDTIQIYGRKIFYLSYVRNKQVLFQESLN